MGVDSIVPRAGKGAPTKGKSMSSANRSVRWLALGAVLLLSSSCLHTQHGRHDRALSVKSEGEADLAHAQAESLRTPGYEEHEYVELATPPEVPAALSETAPSAPSSDHVWISGAHTRRAGEWAWVPGHWALPPRDDVVWVPGHWVPHLHGYVWIAGAWR